MHLYWRIREELRYLGEDLLFRDPRFVREYRRWIRKTSGRPLPFRESPLPAAVKPSDGWVPPVSRN